MVTLVRWLNACNKHTLSSEILGPAVGADPRLSIV